MSNKASVKPGVVEETAAVATVDEEAVALMASEGAVTTSPHAAIGQFEMPSEAMSAFPLSIKYAVSKQVDESITDGSLMIGRKEERYALAKAGEPVNVILLGSRFYARQWLSGEDYMNGVEPKVYNSVEEAKTAGEVFPRDPKGRAKTCGECCSLMMLVEKPTNLQNDGKFCVVIGGREYAPCELRVEKSAFFDFKPNFSTKLLLVRNKKLTDSDGKVIRPARVEDFLMTLTVRKKELKNGKIFYPALGNQTDANGNPKMLSLAEIEELRNIVAGDIRESDLDDDIAE